MCQSRPADIRASLPWAVAWPGSGHYSSSSHQLKFDISEKEHFFLENSCNGFLYNVSLILTRVRPLLLFLSSAQIWHVWTRTFFLKTLTKVFFKMSLWFWPGSGHYSSHNHQLKVSDISVQSFKFLDKLYFSGEKKGKLFKKCSEFSNVF